MGDNVVSDVPYVDGGEYVRADLLAFVGSRQRQSGVLWGARRPGALICTSGGRHGIRAGYQDQEFLGGWIYFGQGTSGDQSLTNPANRRLASRAYSILLFTTREPTACEIRSAGNYGKRFRYQGEFNVLDYDLVQVAYGSRAGQTLIQFNLVRISGAEDETYYSSTSTVNVRAISQTGAATAIRERIASYRIRSQQVRKSALDRAAGHCEGCNAPAPFITEEGAPFLEVHHILRLADEGLDALENVAALCPNCHRRAHYSLDQASFRQQLLSRVRVIES